MLEPRHHNIGSLIASMLEGFEGQAADTDRLTIEISGTPGHLLINVIHNSEKSLIVDRTVFQSGVRCPIYRDIALEVRAAQLPSRPMIRRASIGGQP